jgi:hypothetical protein
MLITKLETRDQIWRYFFRCPALVRPAERPFRRLGYDLEGFGSYHESFGRPTEGLFSWTSDPTLKQSELIRAGANVLPCIMNMEYGEQINCYVLRRGNQGVQVLNQAYFPLNGFDLASPQKAALLRSCKQICNECTQVLYGENTFLFCTLECHNLGKELRSSRKSRPQIHLS